jgi:hypothetical protein
MVVLSRAYFWFDDQTGGVKSNRVAVPPASRCRVSAEHARVSFKQGLIHQQEGPE